MIRRASYLSAGAAFALYAAAGVAAFAEPAPAAAPARHSETIVRSTTDGQTHEVRIVTDPSGRTTITRDGQTTVVDAKQMAENARAMALAGMPRHRDMAEHLRDVLQLRRDQEGALQAYLKALQPERAVMFRSGDDAEKATPERLADMEKALAEHETAVRGYIAATRAFYGQLDASQKKAFDELHLANDRMEMVHRVRMVGPIPRIPPIPPIPPPPIPPAPSL